RAIPTPKVPTEPPQQTARRLTVALPAQVPFLTFGYHAPALSDASTNDDVYALQVLAGILDGGGSSRFSRRLVRERKIAAQTNVEYDAVGLWPTLFTVDAVPAATHSTEELEQALLAEIERMKNEPVSAQELARVKEQTIAEAVYQRDSA